MFLLPTPTMDQLASMCKTPIGKCEEDFSEYSDFHISGEYLYEFGSIRKN
jgi:hypothetical protein